MIKKINSNFSLRPLLHNPDFGIFGIVHDRKPNFALLRLSKLKKATKQYFKQAFISGKYMVKINLKHKNSWIANQK